MFTVRHLATALAFSAAAASAQAVTVGYSTCAALDGSNLTTCESGATVWDFSATMHSYTGNGARVSGSSSGVYAAPAGDATHYLTVPAPSGTTGEVTSGPLSSSYNYFGLYWGSMDDYNTLSFYSVGAPVATFTGTDVITALTLLGNQTDPGSNRYVDFYFGAGSYDEVRIASTQYAFESDNHAFANVPEPMSLALLGLGLAGIGFARRRRA